MLNLEKIYLVNVSSYKLFDDLNDWIYMSFPVIGYSWRSVFNWKVDKC
jgi:hypothetical protein